MYKIRWFWCFEQELWLLKVSWSDFVSLKKAVFEAVFWTKSSFWLTSTKGRPPLNIHGWKATDLSFLMVFLKKYFFHPVKRQNFDDALGQTFYMTWDCVVGKKSLKIHERRKNYSDKTVWTGMPKGIIYKKNIFFNKFFWWPKLAIFSQNGHFLPLNGRQDRQDFAQSCPRGWTPQMYLKFHWRH